MRENIFFLEKVENIVGMGANAGYQRFLLFPHCLQKASLFIEITFNAKLESLLYVSSHFYIGSLLETSSEF